MGDSIGKTKSLLNLAVPHANRFPSRCYLRLRVRGNTKYSAVMEHNLQRLGRPSSEARMPRPLWYRGSSHDTEPDRSLHEVLAGFSSPQRARKAQFE